MIIECLSCHARYMVPIGLFAAGGRKVRCARCKYEWHEKLPTSVDVFVPLPETRQSLFVPSTRPAASFSPVPPPIPENAPVPDKSLFPPIPPFVANLPAVIARQDWKKIALRASIAAATIAALVAWPILARDPIVKAVPALRDTYEALGFSIRHVGQGLVFEHVRSELKYDGGTMRLFVDGDIQNTTEEAQLVPDIKARAIGPDQRIIQSWWVAPPTATVDAGSAVSFHTEVSTPMKYTIENVYLEFYSQEEKGDGTLP